MKNNILHRFAINDLKTHRKDVSWSIITIFVVSILVMLISLISPYIINQKFVDYQRQNGIYNYFVLDISIHDINNMELYLAKDKVTLDDLRLSVCYTIPSGYTLNSESMTEIKNNPEIIATHIKEGRMPTNKHEIAVKEKVFKNWGYSQKLNQNIKLSFTHEEKVYVQEFQVVGILKETGDTTIAVSNLFDSPYSIYIDVKDDTLIHNMSEYGLIQSPTINDLGMGIYVTSSIFILIQVAIFIVAYALLYGLTLSSFEKKQRDYILLRSIGATQRQIYYVIFIQVLLLSVCPIFISMFLVYIISLFIPHITQTTLPLLFNISTMLWNAFVIFAIVFISYFIPAKSACRQALLGTFEQREFQYFYYHYKKLHHIRPFYLAWRQLVSLKKKMIMKIFFIAVISLSCMYIVGERVYHSFAVENYQEIIDQKGEGIEYILRKEDESFDIKDFDFYKPYCKSISVYQYFDNDDLRAGFLYNSEFVQYNLPYKLYCINDNLKKQYQISNLQPQQVIFSRGHIKNTLENYKLHDTIDFLGEKYELSQIIDDDFESFAIVSESDFEKYQFIEVQQKIIIRFDDIHQKNKAFIDVPQDIHELDKKYYAMDLQVNIKSLVESQMITQEGMTISFWKNVFIIILLAIIYIYQFVFELLKQREDIGTYQLLGMTHKEIWLIYFYKALLIGVVGLLCGGVYYFLDGYHEYQSLSNEGLFYQISTLLPTMLLAFIVVIVMIVISLIPLRGILKRGAFENKNIRE